MQKNKSLLLFTNNYPANYGDSSFIRPEVETLSEIYDKVYIIRFAKNNSFADISMPDNFYLFEQGLAGKVDIIIKGILNSTSLTKTYKLLIQEFPHIKKCTHLKNLVFATLCSRHFSSKVNNLIKNSEENFDAYLFWGMGSGYSLPLISHSHLNKIWMRLHGGDLYLERQNGYIPYRKAMFSFSNVIMPISHQGEKYLIDTYPIANIQRKIFTNYLGSIDYGIMPKKQNRLIYLIVSCSSIIPLKRVELIFQSIYLASQSIEIVWHHFGDGCNMSILKALIQNYSYSKNLQIHLHGQVSHETIIEFYQNNHIDLFINLSETEGIPVSIMEAISFDIPIIATDVGGVCEIVGKSLGTGGLIPIDLNEEKIAEEIHNILNERNLSPRKLWKTYFDKDNNMKLLVEKLGLHKTTNS